MSVNNFQRKNQCIDVLTCKSPAQIQLQLKMKGPFPSILLMQVKPFTTAPTFKRE